MKRLTTILILLTSLALSLPALAEVTAAGAGVRRFALVVGANNGGAARVQLSYAASDARAFAEVIGDLGGVSANDLILLQDPDRAAVEAGFADLSARVAAAGEGHARTEVIFYYSGHSDEEGLRLGEDLFGYKDLKDLLFSVPSDVRLAILDSCASGTLTRVKGGSFQPPFLVDDASQVKGYAILTSSSADEAAQESDRLQGSFFTHSLVSGLRGAADTTGDSRVTLNEVYHFAFNDTLARTETTQVGAQHPAYDIQLAGTGDLVLTDLRQTSAILSLGEELDGRVFIRDASGRLVLEVRKVAGQHMDLALAPGSYAITVQVAGGVVRQGDIVLRQGDTERLEPGTLSVVDSEQVATRGDSDISVSIAVEGAARPPCPDVKKLQLNILNNAKAIDGMQIALVGNRTECDVNGFQGSLALNRIGRDLDGVQVAVGLNTVGGDVDGGQLSSSVNVTTGSVEGAQVAAGFNVARGGIHGLQAAGGFGIAEGVVDGVQGAGGFNLSGGLRGLEAAGGFNIAHGTVLGVQGAGGFNISGTVERGGQAAGGFNVAWGDVNGLQAAGGFNIAKGNVNGVQATSGFNVTRGAFHGLQTSGGFSYAGDVTGAQISVLNIARDVSGTQIGVVNIARDVKGLQLGLVNVAKSVDGVPIGLLNFVKEGEHRFSLWADDMGHTNLGFSLGSDKLYTLFAAGISAAHPGRYSWGMGLGWHFMGRRWYVDPLVGAYQVYDRDIGWADLNLLTQGQLQIGRVFFDRFSVFAGPTFNVHLTTDEANKVQLSPIPTRCPCEGIEDGTVVRMWPGFVAGVGLHL